MDFQEKNQLKFITSVFLFLFTSPPGFFPREFLAPLKIHLLLRLYKRRSSLSFVNASDGKFLYCQCDCGRRESSCALV